MSDVMHTPSEFILYQTEDGRTRSQCRFENETIWLSQIQIAELFQTTKQNIAKHLKAIFAEGEMKQESVVNYWLTTADDGKDYRVMYYNLSAIIAVGYRVRSHRGTQFRQWATERLGEYLLKGFTMDDERLKNPPGPGQKDYFEEQLERIRDIRSSERRFYQKILDISPPAPTTPPAPKPRANSSPPCRTKCTGPPTARPRQRSSITGPMRASRIWACKPPGPAALFARTMWRSPKTISPRTNSMP